MNHVFNQLGGLNLYQNPLQTNMGHLIHAVNVESVPYGAKTKRPGFQYYEATPTLQNPTQLIYFPQVWPFYMILAKAGSVIHQSWNQAAFAPAGEGTFGTSSGTLGHAIMSNGTQNVLIIGDGLGSTRHWFSTTSNIGTGFVNTPLAPVSSNFAEYQNRFYAGGTNNFLFASTGNDGTNWNTTGTSDSFSVSLSGAGRISSVFNNNGLLIIGKDTGILNTWDGDTRSDISTLLGPSQPRVVSQVENHHLWFRPGKGIFDFNGAQPRLISNAIQDIVYNNAGSGISPSYAFIMEGGVWRNDYLLTAGTLISDTITQRKVTNPIIKYNFQQNEFLLWSYPIFMNDISSYRDDFYRDKLLLAGDFVYRSEGTELTDNGTAIPVIMEYVVHWNTMRDKTWQNIILQFNPGCQAQVSIACADSFQDREKRYQPLGDVSSGKISQRFPQGSESTYLFIKVTESSKTARFTWYGFELEAEIVKRR